MAYSVPRMDFKNQGSNRVFAADLHRCCQHNISMGWPRFVRNLWQATGDRGLLAWLYSPNTVTARVGSAGSRVTIVSETQYPFSDCVDMTVRTDRTVAFPLYLRVPGWCLQVEVKVAGENKRITASPGKLVKIARKWSDGDRVEVRFGMEVSCTVWPRNGAITIDRGPLSYSVRIAERWEKIAENPKGWPRWSLTPATPWNYGLAIDPKNPSDATEVKIAHKLALQPWSEKGAPIVLKVPARRIPGWEARIKSTVDSVREGPVKSDEPVETIEMIPMGCAHLRMSVLPVVNGNKDARYWGDIPNPDVFMLDRLDK